MNVPPWLNQATHSLNGENGSHNPAVAPSMNFSRPHSMATLNPSQLQYQQMQLRMQNGNMHHGPPSSQSPMYNTQNVVPSKRSRPRESSISATSPSYPKGTPVSNLQTPQAAYPDIPRAIHGGPQYRESVAYHQHQQYNNGSVQSPMSDHQDFNYQNSSAVIHRPSPSFSPAIPRFSAPSADLQPDHAIQAESAQRNGQMLPSYGTDQMRVHPTQSTMNRMSDSELTDPPKAHIPQQRMYVAAGARMMQQGQTSTWTTNTDVPHNLEISNNLVNRTSRPTQSRNSDQSIQTRRHAQARVDQIQSKTRASHLGWLLRSMIQYMHSRRLPFNHRPVIATKSVSCVIIYLIGMKLGGSNTIQRLSQWPQVARLLAIPPTKIAEGGRELRLYWEENLLRWERYVVRLEQSKTLSRQRQRIVKNNLRIMERSQKSELAIGLASIAQLNKLRAIQEQHQLIHPPRPFGESKKAISLTRHALHQEDLHNEFNIQLKNHILQDQSQIPELSVLPKLQGLPYSSKARSDAASRDKTQDAMQDSLSENTLPKKVSKETLVKLIERGVFRVKKTQLTLPKMEAKPIKFKDEKSKNTFLKMLAEGTFRKNKAKTGLQKRKAEQGFLRTEGTAKSLLLRMISQGIFPKTSLKDVIPKFMMKDAFPKTMIQDNILTSNKKVAVPTMKAKKTLSGGTDRAPLSGLKLQSPRPIMSYYTPKIHTLDPSTGERNHHRRLRKSPRLLRHLLAPETEHANSRPEYHGGLPISNPWYKSASDEVVRFKHSTPQFNELDTIDIQALILSLKSGIHGEVRLALDILAALSRIGPPPLRECEELLETLIDFASDQIEVLERGSRKSSDFPYFLSQQEQIREFQKQSYMLQEVSDLGSSCHHLDRAANRLVSIMTILRNLSLLSDNLESLGEPSILQTMTTVVRCLGTHELFLRTHQNALDLSNEMVTFLSALSPEIDLQSKEDGLAVLQFLLSFAPEPQAKIMVDKISFASYNPILHRHLPFAVDALAKLMARDPNRTMYRIIFASESASSTSCPLSTRAFGLAVSVIPDFVRPVQIRSIIAKRGSLIAQGLLLAEILVDMLPIAAYDIAYSWLNSQDGFVSRLMSLLSLTSKLPTRALQQGTVGKLRTTGDIVLGQQMVNFRGRALLTKLAERAQDTAGFASDFSPHVLRLKQSISQTSRLNKKL